MIAPPRLEAAPNRPVLQGRHWVAVTGKPLAAMAGARMFEKGGNAVDAACAMLGAVCTLFDDVGWGGETQALLYDPIQRRVIGINACGVAPARASVAFFKERNMDYPPEDGPLAALTPGNPGGLMVMLAEFGTLSLEEVLGPAMELADGFPTDASLTAKIENAKSKLKQWPSSRRAFFPHSGEAWEGPRPGELFRQPALLATLEKLVAAEAEALAAGRTRKQAIYSAYDRFYKGDIAEAVCQGVQELGGLFQIKDLAEWRVKLEEPVSTTYKTIEVYKLTSWTQGPVLLQMLNMVEDLDVKSMGYNSARYLHTLYQIMNLAFADRDFYYGDPYAQPLEPVRGLLSKSYARERLAELDWSRNRRDINPGDPYPHQDEENPYRGLLDLWNRSRARWSRPPRNNAESAKLDADFQVGTTSIQAADKAGWAVSITPSGGWMPSCLAGETGVSLSQRMQSFVMDESENPFNVLEPGKRPRVTLTPSLALREGRPFLCFSVQGGDTQEQNLLQFFLNIVEFEMGLQEACEAANMNSHQMRSSFGEHRAQPGRMTLAEEVPSWVRNELRALGYRLDFDDRTSGPITAILFDQRHGTLQGAASNFGEDYGLAW